MMARTCVVLAGVLCALLAPRAVLAQRPFYAQGSWDNMYGRQSTATAVPPPSTTPGSGLEVRIDGSQTGNGGTNAGFGPGMGSSSGIQFRVFNNVPIQAPEPCVGCLYRLTRQGFVRVNSVGGQLTGGTRRG